MNINDFPFGDLLKKAWAWTYRNKILWVIAFFAGSGGYFFNLMPDAESWKPSAEMSSSTGNFFSNLKLVTHQVPLMVLLVVLVVLIFVFLYLLNLAARAGVIQGLRTIKEEKKYRFWQLVGFGFRKMPRLLLVSIIWGIPNVLLVILMIGGVLLGSWYGITLVSLFGLLLLVYNVYVALIRHYVYCEAVLENKDAWQAIQVGMKLVNKNFWVVLIAGLIQIGLGIVIGLAILLGIIIVAIPFVLLGVFLGLAMGAFGLAIPAIIAGVLIVALAFVLRGGISFYFNAFLTNVYWKLDR